MQFYKIVISENFLFNYSKDSETLKKMIIAQNAFSTPFLNCCFRSKTNTDMGRQEWPT